MWPSGLCFVAFTKKVHHLRRLRFFKLKRQGLENVKAIKPSIYMQVNTDLKICTLSPTVYSVPGTVPDLQQMINNSLVLNKKKRSRMLLLGKMVFFEDVILGLQI